MDKLIVKSLLLFFFDLQLPLFRYSSSSQADWRIVVMEYDDQSAYCIIRVHQSSSIATNKYEKVGWLSKKLPLIILPFKEGKKDKYTPELLKVEEVLYGENSGLYEDEREQISSSTFDSYDNNTLSVLFRPPYELLYNGPFDDAKEADEKRNRWLLVNVQSRSEFDSDTLNRDTWANDIVAQMIENNFVFWQEGDHTEEGREVCSCYKLDSRPVILVIDHITGQKMRSWNGMVQPETLLENAMTFIDRTPSEYHSDLLRKQLERLTHLDRIEKGTEEKEMEITSEEENDQNELLMNTNTIYLPLPEEPNRSLISNCDKNLVCRIAIRLPDGRRIQRNFMKTDPIKLLWSFCSTQFEEAKTRAFRFRRAMPGPTKFWASKFWTCDSNLTFEESGLDNSINDIDFDLDFYFYT
ncbi:hypothetical protein H5410_043842 [Solanum commersonii]|uniref:UBX domain-containing protein n=1 Tax=Solanum commersonii TaxID=4109 RepID=A0A9J5Y1D2_SOLCO|nr:hypothetical protein H5410_043842 [Solanum commersonii]